MSIQRLRLAKGSRAHPHPEGEVVLYKEHQREVERLRALLEKSSLYARSWKQYAQNLSGAANAEKEGDDG